MTLEVLAQIQIRERRGDDCVSENGFCPDWIADNIGKYWSPLLEHVMLTVVSVGIGFAIAFALAILAHRQRWLTGPIVGFTGALYTVPSVAASSPGWTIAARHRSTSRTRCRARRLRARSAPTNCST